MRIAAWAIKLIWSSNFQPILSVSLRNIGEPIVNPIKNIPAKEAISKCDLQ